MVYEIKDLKRHAEEIKGVLFRMGLNPTRDQAILLDQTQNTVDELEENIKTIEKAFK